MIGIDDPYEPPSHPELNLDSSRMSIEQLVERVTGYLVEHGLLGKK
jgi:adenylylsulfate kinase/bifunctional enzyme CysN/CysC